MTAREVEKLYRQLAKARRIHDRVAVIFLEQRIACATERRMAA